MPDQKKPSEINELNAGIAQLRHLLQGKKIAEGRRLAKTLLNRWPDSIQLLMLCAQIQQLLGNFDEMLDLALRAQHLDKQNLSIQFKVLEYRIYCGQFQQVLQVLSELETRFGSSSVPGPQAWRQLAQLYTHCGQHAEAVRCDQQAVELAAQQKKSDSNLLFNYASSLIAVGQLREAEGQLNQLIKVAPEDYPAYMNRSTLRKQNPESNHIQALTSLTKKPFKHPSGEAQINYALGKEYEDLDKSELAFEHYQKGAAARRKLLSYEVANDVQIMDRIIEVFDSGMLASTSSSSSSPGFSGPGPVFVMGLPRSGTTLVDRILASHSGVDSLGEINDFALALIRTAGAGTDKHQILEAATTMDFQLLGQRYLDSTRERGNRAPMRIDKTPLNYLYLGLIHLSLPTARIIYVRRQAMDVCFAMYKTLFLMGYPFSYSLDDLAHYYAAFDRLMRHWQSVLPDRFMTLDYQDLVEQQRPTTQSMLEHIGLNWEERCMNFHENPSASATAAAAQVRQPMYRSSLNRWKKYQTQLEPLRKKLAELGIAV